MRTVYGVNLVVNVENVSVVKAANHVKTDAHLANGAEELVAETLAVVSPLDESSHVDELHLVIHHLLRMTNVC